MKEEGLDTIFSLASKKRKNSKVSMEYKPRNFNKHLKGAEKANARYCVLLGEDEMKNSTVWLKDMETKEEKTISFEEL
jgi:histidyl-tRNA synthetase